MSRSQESKFESLCEYGRQIAVLASTQAVLEWDEHTHLPAAAGEYRAKQVSTLASLVHARRTDARLGELLGELRESPLAHDPATRTGCIIQRMSEDYNRHAKLPARLVEELSHATSLGQQIWVKARAADDFEQFRPSLERILSLKREQAQALGYQKSPYEPLLDEYEPGASVEGIALVLKDLVQSLKQLHDQMFASGRHMDKSCLHRVFPVAEQGKMGRLACEKIGFDFERGMLDVTTHPFCSDLGPYDCRITTRYRVDSFSDAFFSTLHEAGHGLYEQGLVSEDYGLPTGQAVSLGVHESQSRMWENIVGRSLAFWRHFMPHVKSLFPSAAREVSLEDWYAAVNDVRPSLIRVEADEVTYNLHIIIRFELERDLIEERLPVSELPQAWNQKYRDYLGLEPPSAALGVLQDVHWSAGLFGYFPTYSLGNLYAAQLFEQAEAELGNLAEMFAVGDFAPLRHWLLVNIHRQGRRYSPTDLIKKTARRELSSRELVQYLRRKLAPMYNL